MTQKKITSLKKKTKPSSQRWLLRHLNDPYVQRAQRLDARELPGEQLVQRGPEAEHVEALVGGGEAGLERLIAHVARYHGKGRPRKRDDSFARLSKRDRQLVQWLAAILRIAAAAKERDASLCGGLALGLAEATTAALAAPRAASSTTTAVPSRQNPTPWVLCPRPTTSVRWAESRSAASSRSSLEPSCKGVQGRSGRLGPRKVTPRVQLARRRLRSKARALAARAMRPRW